MAASTPVGFTLVCTRPEASCSVSNFSTLSAGVSPGGNTSGRGPHGEWTVLERAPGPQKFVLFYRHPFHGPRDTPVPATAPPHDTVPETVCHVRDSCSGVSERRKS